MHYCSIAYSQLGQGNIEFNNGDDYDDDGQADDHDIYCDHFHNYWWSGCDFDYTTITLNHGYGNDFELDHLQDVDISNGVDRGYDYMMIKLVIIVMFISTERVL